MLLARLVRIALAFVALVLPVAADDIVFTGEVTYRERIALPPGAELWVSLVALPEARPVVGAAAAIATKGQVPIAFTLSIRSDVARPGRDYGLVAEIRSAGRTMFRNFQPVPVDVVAPVPVRILVQFAPEPPHDPPPPATPPVAEPPVSLLDTTWRVTSIGGEPALPEPASTLAIAADRSVGGNGACNNYFTEASFENETLAFGPVAATRMACEPAISAQEAAFFAALEAVAGYELEGEGLKLLDAAGVPLVGLVRTP